MFHITYLFQSNFLTKNQGDALYKKKEAIESHKVKADAVVWTL